uniref:Flagellar biosynthetic protein FlhB n=1 Tax=Desulfatirhabdium butyrativorans TaxID=340467 RepID=A0A7C4MQ41_9BACT
MPEDSGQERTEKATAKKREEAREKGQVASSKEVSSALIILGALMALAVSGSWSADRIARSMQHFWANSGQMALLPSNIQHLLVKVLMDFFLAVFPVFIAVLVATVVGNVLQVGFMISSEALTPKFSKLNPLTGIKRLLSVRSFAEVLKAIFKIGCLGYVGWLVLRSESESFPVLVQVELIDIAGYLWRVTLKIGFFSLLVMMVLAGMDYGFQRWQYEKDLRMTKQEVKEEMKQTEGDPKIKSRIRSIQMELARRRMMAAVPSATVVITNPTHLAVALQYQSGMTAPKVVAKGAGFVALRIREIAAEHHVPIIENKPVAQALYKAVPLGQSIPVDLYQAVAEILAFVYRMKRS